MRNSSIKVLFSGAEHRMRRIETISHPPGGIKFLPFSSINQMRKDWELTNIRSENSLLKNWRYASRILTHNNLIPKKKLKNVGLIYSPGYCVLNKFPFVIEIDNVAVLAYYKLFLLDLLKPVIKRVLKSRYCKRIICISEAAKKSVVNYFNDKGIEKKCSVVYPYIKEQKISKKQGKKIRFLFVSSNFYLKGGKEVVNAFLNIERKFKDKAELCIITKIKEIDKSMRDKINSSKNIHLVESNLDKSMLFKRHYLKSDVFVLPTYQDSFGMVYLEALSAGLPIIATDMFAVPEMVIDGKNGFLCHSPVPYFKKNFLPNPVWWEKDKSKYANENTFPEVEKFVADKMIFMIQNSSLRARMGQESLNLLHKKFSDKARKEKLGKIIRKAVKCAE